MLGVIVQITRRFGYSNAANAMMCTNKTNQYHNECASIFIQDEKNKDYFVYDPDSKLHTSCWEFHPNKKSHHAFCQPVKEMEGIVVLNDPLFQQLFREEFSCDHMNALNATTKKQNITRFFIFIFLRKLVMG